MALEQLLEAIVPEDIQAFIRAITTPEDYLLTREVFAERASTTSSSVPRAASGESTRRGSARGKPLR